MKLFIDNTALHTVGRCLDGDARGEPDVAGLLQFATQLVFSDALLYSAFASTAVAARSEEFREKLSKLGIRSGELRLSPFDVTTYERTLLGAAEHLADDLQFAYSPRMAKSPLIATSLPDLKPLEQEHYDNLHLAIKSSSDKLRHELTAAEADARLMGSGVRLLTISDKLWIEACRLARNRSWRKADTSKLIVMMRCYLNQDLATLLSQSEHDSVDYSPSVARARIIQAQDAYALSKLSEAVGVAAHKLDGIELEAPPVALALALKAKGDPKGIIEEALIAREKATELRRYLRRVVDAARKEASADSEASKKDATIHRLRNAVRELATLLEQDLGIAPPPTLLSAFEISMIGPVPIPPLRKMVEWAEHKWNRPRITILSEFAKTLANPTSDKFALQKLYAACQRNTKPTS